MLLLLFSMVQVVAGAFVVPEDGPVPFERDKLPVDVATMTKLSRQLVVLAGQVSADHPEGRRTLAQMMALSRALDPANPRIPELMEQLGEGGEIPRAEERDLDMSRSRAWDLLGWLEQPEAGEDGQALGACLSDVLVLADPAHPLAKERLGKAERGQWAGWVASVDRFRGEESSPTPVPEPVEPQGDVAQIKLRDVSARMPIRTWNKDTRRWTIKATEFKLRTWVNEEGEGLVLQLPGEEWETAKERPNHELASFLSSRYGPLPKGLSMKLRLEEDEKLDYGRDGKALTLLVPVMANAAFSGVAPEGMIVAAFDDSGSIVAPNRFWETLRALSENEEDGGRLIIPESLKDHLPPLLALEKADFFFRYEVLLARDVEEMLAMGSSEPPENVVEAASAFAVVKEARGTRSLGSFVAHPSTQQRLQQIAAACPVHASSRMLALRGTSSWPRRLEKKFYAMEVRAAIEPMGSVLKGRWGSMKTRLLLETFERCREGLTAVEKLYGSMAEKAEIYDRAVGTVKELPGLVADIKRLGEDDEWRMASIVRKPYLDYVETVTHLTELAGDANSYPLPDRERRE